MPLMANQAKEFTQKILKTTFSTSKSKEKLFEICKEAERNCLISQAKKSRIQMPNSAAMQFIFCAGGNAK